MQVCARVSDCRFACRLEPLRRRRRPTMSTPADRTHATAARPQPPGKHWRRRTPRRLHRATKCCSPAAASGREPLLASSSGTPAKPIIYAAGAGDKPRFWGSDVLKNADFQVVAKDVWKIAAPLAYWPCRAGQPSIPACGRGPQLPLDAKPNTWFCDEVAKTLFIHSTSDPRSDNRIYTACVRRSGAFQLQTPTACVSRFDRR